MLKRLALVVLVIFCGGCAITMTGILTPQGSAVQLADDNIVRKCQYLGDVTGVANDTESARNDARNRAAAWGATHVVFVSQTWYQAMARAYGCPVPIPAEAQAPAPAQAPADGANSAHVAKVRTREQEAGAAADKAADQH